MEKERRLYVEGVDCLYKEDHDKNERAIINALSIYSQISDRFEKDSKFGSEWVYDHPDVIAQLTVAAAKMREK